MSDMEAEIKGDIKTCVYRYFKEDEWNYGCMML